jgi:hypothetical protein
MSEVFFDFIRFELANKLGRDPNESELDLAFSEVTEETMKVFSAKESLLIN